MNKCRVCKEQVIQWAWQPLGPGKDNDTFMLPGHHYRGFPVLGICDSCKQNIARGGEVKYTYKGQQYIANEQPRPLYYPADVHTPLWNGGTGTWEPDGSCTLICRDIAGADDHDIVALVVDPQLAELFIIAPALLRCSEVLRDMVETHQETLEDDYYQAVKALSALDFAVRMNTK